MITVLMSTYNGEKYIKEQIDSILNQQEVDIRLLVRDDGSTDDTLEILNYYKKTYKNVDWYSGNNLGAGKSFYQLVLDAPDSEYYAFADQDDVWDYNKMSVALSKINLVPSTTPSLYCSAARPVDAELNPINEREAISVKLTLGIILTQSISPGCSFVFNKILLEKFKKIGIESIDIHDWAMLRVVSAINGHVFYDKEPHFSYRQHGNNVIGYQGSTIEQWTGRFKRFFKEENKQIRYRMAVRVKNAYYDEMSLENKQVIDKFINYKLGWKNRLSLLMSNDIRMIKKVDNLVFKLLVVSGLV